MSKKLISIVVPFYFEEYLINEFYNRMKKVLDSISDKYFYEIVCVDDGSQDNTYNLLLDIQKQDKNVKILKFSRNFGHQLAITAGMDYASGDLAIIIDSDLQDPPEVILEMLKKWEEGYKVVYGVRKKRKGESIFKLITAKIFYRLIEKMSTVKIPTDVGDFRLIDRCILDQLKIIKEENRYIRGLVSWVGFKQTGVFYERDERYAGETKYTLSKMIKFALDGIVSFSDKPLHLVSVLGFIITLIAILFGLIVLVSKIINPVAIVSGWSSLIIIILFLGGVQVFSIGIVGLYLGRVYTESKKRPLYVIEEKKGF
jgi:dolichol-phosphate mannosyltransferase